MVDFSDYQFGAIPFDRIVRVGQRTLLSNDLFCVSWLLGRYCNYRCSYCWPYARSDKKDHRPTEQLISTLDEIKRQARALGFNSFHFSFSGGEPTFHPGYLDLLQHYASDLPQINYQSAHMTTNLSQPLSWFEKYVTVTKDLHRVSVTASFHKQFAKRDLFREKLIFLQESEVQVTINMVLSPERFNESWEDAQHFHENGINVTLKPQSDEKASKIVSGYTTHQLQLLQEGLPQREYTLAKTQKKSGLSSSRPKATNFQRPPSISNEKQGGIRQTMQVELTDDAGNLWYMDQAERFNAFDFNNFKDWDCSAGMRSLIIREPGGVIKRGYSCAEDPLGSIDEGFRLYQKPMRCGSQSCVSSADSKIPKRSNQSKLPLWPGDKSHADSQD